MKKSLKLPIILALTLLVSACSTNAGKQAIADLVIEPLAGADISYNEAQCPMVKSRCHEGEYNEWLQPNGKLACACNK